MNNRGFTIIEIVMVIIVIAIIAAVAVPQFSRYWAGIKLNNAVMKIASDIRYAQNRATTTQQRSRINFTSATLYDVQYCNSTYSTATCKCPDPADNQWVSATGFPVNLSNTEFSGVTISGIVNDCVEFDSLGKPYLNTTCNTVTSCNASAGATVTVSYSGSPKNITVTTQTGMVSY